MLGFPKKLNNGKDRHLKPRDDKFYHRLLLLFLVLVLFGLIEAYAIIWHVNQRPAKSSTVVTKHSNKPKSQPQTDQTSPVPKQDTFDAKQFSLNDPTSIWVVVNKGRVLPSGYVPVNLTVPDVPLRASASAENMHLRSNVSIALGQLVDAGNNEGIHLMLTSGYRSYSYQEQTYNGYVAQSGQAQADTYSARPGHSEHQTGLAADLEPTSHNCELDQCFGDTPEGKWLVANAYKYGFIIRYPLGKDNLTGYQYEPWHVRYLGVGLATEIEKTGQTLEQFFGLPIYATYPSESYQLMAGT
ncbi:MAG TPA: M15 family metallopeptidase [Candidatus Saccharimonadales bacterium]|nr:M15 family metallopeptidase [Candidatus Saccharimonadales bacterium]